MNSVSEATLDKRTECIARYLNRSIGPTTQHLPPLETKRYNNKCEDDFDTSHFKFQHFDKGLRSMKNDKQPRNDGLIMELQTDEQRKQRAAADCRYLK